MNTLLADLLVRVIIIVTVIDALVFYALWSKRATLNLMFAASTIALTIIVLAISVVFDLWRFKML